tara:strand:+ start:4733 stop:4957 length:225 start_codon:yes stop_codon:yes gene_type:complete
MYAKDHTVPDRYRGWLIEQNWLGIWEATHPNFDASYEGPEDGWVGSPHMSATAKTREELESEIDDCIHWLEDEE